MKKRLFKEKLNRLLETAELTMSDYARLLGVTRVTIHSWSHGRAEPHKLLQGENNKLLLAVSLAIESGDLPLNCKARKTRAARLKEIIDRHRTS